MREKYESLPVLTLKELAKARGIKHVSALKKSEVIELMLAEDEREKQAGAQEPEAGRPAPARSAGRPSGRRDTRSQESAAEERGSGRPTAGHGQERAAASRTEERSADRTAGIRGEERGVDRTADTRGEERGADRTAGTRGEGRGTERPQAFRGEERGTERPQVSRGEERGTERSQTFRGEERGTERPQASRGEERSVDRSDKPPMDLAQLDSGQTAHGILEVMPDGYGFIRSDNYLPGENDVYVAPSQIRKFNLKTGDIISGNTRIKAQQEKFSALLYLKSINGLPPAEATKRCNFEDMTPIFPNERLRMERTGSETAMRIVDLISPIGKGQRGMIVSPPKAGKTTLLKDIAKSILKNDENMKLIILLIDERPEEVTDIKEAICGSNVEVIYSTFDELPEHHKRVSEMVIERAKRLVEHKQDVTILLDSITRLARAYNLTVPPSGRTLSGGLDPAALHMPKRFFGAARNMREGGSLTILATALVDTGSKMDDVVYEEFKGTGNMELVLDRKLSERRVFPAIDIPKSGTRREDLLLDKEEQEAIYFMRKAINGQKSEEAVENILNMFVRTRDNRELVQRVRKQKYI